MLLKLKAWVQPLGQFLAKKLKPPTSSAKPLGLHQVYQLQNQFAASTSKAVKEYQNVALRQYLCKTFPAFKAFSPLPAPVPLRGPIGSKMYCHQGRTFITSPAFLRNITRGNNGFGCSRGFCSTPTAVINNVSSNGGILAHLATKAFTMSANRTGSLWVKTQGHFEKPNVKYNFGKLATIENEENNHSITVEPIKSLGITKVTPNRAQDKCDKDTKVNQKVICGANSINKLEQKQQPATNVNPSQNLSKKACTRVFMSMLINPALFWDCEMDPYSKQKHLDSAWVQNLADFAQIQHTYMQEIISILKLLMSHGTFDIRIFNYELRVYFPDGMGIDQVKALLNGLGIDPQDSHFSLEEDISKSNNENVLDFDSEINLGDPSLSTSRPLTLPYAHPHNRQSRSRIPILYPSSPILRPLQLDNEYVHGIQDFLKVTDELNLSSLNVNRSKRLSSIDLGSLVITPVF